jgi:3-isopropylmalate/(R)-2-methylmalate dehydratase small subunit
MERHTGAVIKLGDNIDTDVIIPTQYMTLKTIQDMVPHAFSPLRPGLPDEINAGAILVCGKNFGCGSSREQAPEILKALGLYCVVAKSFARIFYRNAINNGLLLIESEKLYDRVEEGQELTVDLHKHHFISGASDPISFGRIPAMLLEMIKMGGLVPYWKKRNS